MLKWRTTVMAQAHSPRGAATAFPDGPLRAKLYAGMNGIRRRQAAVGRRFLAAAAGRRCRAPARRWYSCTAIRCGSDWITLMKRVAGFATVVAPDMPGFGGADKRADQTTPGGLRAVLDGVIRPSGIERVHLVAHDFGGPFAPPGPPPTARRSPVSR